MPGKSLSRDPDQTGVMDNIHNYVISAISAFLYDTNNFLESHKGILDDICCIVSFFNGSEMYRRGSSVILSNHPAYHELHEYEETNDPRRIKQRTERWLDLRKQALVREVPFMLQLD